MSEDESFVVLGSSPLNSLKSVPQTIEIEMVSKLKDVDDNNTSHHQQDEELRSDEKQKSITTNALSGSCSEYLLVDDASSSSNSGMAASFILGEVRPEVLKESVYSQFPSLSLNEPLKSSEMMKIHSLLTSNIEMKEVLRNTNDSMSDFMSKTKKTLDEYKDHLRECQAEIRQLRSENISLQKELHEKIQHIEMMEQIRTTENEQLRNGISEKSSQIMEMREHISNLEHQENHKFVPISEHKKILEQFETKMSVILAENMEIKEMQAQYVDEITCLKVNLVSCEELYKKAKFDIKALQSNEGKKSIEVVEYENKLKSIEDEVTVLRIQVDTYKKDFEAERCSRENLAGERDNLWLELRKLQTSNQKLVEEAELNSKRIQKNNSKKEVPAIPITNESIQQVYKRVVYSCPLCGVEHKTLGALQDHVQACLNDNS